jgi:hypothetical protein
VVFSCGAWDWLKEQTGADFSVLVPAGGEAFFFLRRKKNKPSFREGIHTDQGD